MAAMLKVQHHGQNLTINRCVIARGTILPNFIPTGFETMELWVFFVAVAPTSTTTTTTTRTT